MGINLGAAMAGGNGKRRAHDFYPTPRAATVALINAFHDEIPRSVWEPACGDGAMARVFEEYGFDVFASDLIDRGCGEPGYDFLACQYRVRSAIITNPPFALAAEFIEHALALGAEWVAMLLKAQFFHAAARLELPRPNIIAPLAWRLDFTGGGAPTMDCTWFVWSRARTGVEFRPLPKPTTDLFA